MTTATVDIMDLKPMEYQMVFVRFQREKYSTFVNVLLDGCHLAWFLCDALTEEEFEKACEEFTASEKYRTSYNEFMGRDLL